MVGQSHAPAALPQGMTRDPLCMRLGGGPHRVSNPGPSRLLLVAIPTELSRLHTALDCFFLFIYYACSITISNTTCCTLQLWIVNLYTSYITGELNKYSACTEVMKFGLGQRRG